MSTREKLIERFCRFPSDFTFNELVQLFGCFGYELYNKGITSGSRVLFKKGDSCYLTHRPHPHNTVRKAALKDVYMFLLINGLL